MTVTRLATAWMSSLSPWHRARPLAARGPARRADAERGPDEGAAQDDDALSDELVDLATGGGAIPPATEE